MAAIAKQAQTMTQRLTEPEQIHRALAQVFQDSQQSVSGHRKQVHFLKAIQSRASELDFEESFNYYFCQLINKVLVLKRTESVGDRIAKLVASFVMSLEKDFAKDGEQEEEEDDNDEADDNIFTRFVHYFVTHLLRGIEAKDKNVRYRVVQFLNLTMGGLGEISDDMYDTLMFQLEKRMHDKEPSIRIKALQCIARFQDAEEEQGDEVDEATAKLIVAIQNDPSPEVRRAALLNLAKTSITKNYLLERAKDTNSTNRRLVYSRVMKEMGDFRTIDYKTREKLLSWGLKDREETVQKACLKMFSNDWLSTIGGDLIELLERLHIIRSEVAELAMKKFFEFRKDLTSKISFPPNIWQKLTPEIAFLARSFYDHCVDSTLNDVIDQNYPESAELAQLLSKYLEERKKMENLDDSEDYGFLIEQLLKIGVKYDFSDEIGRREMLRVVRSSLTNDRLTEKLIAASLQVLRKLSISERDFCSMVTEIITDISDSAEDEEDSEKQKVTIHCLCICKSMLKLTNDPLKDNMSIDSLIDTLINPAVRSQVSEIRELGTEALGLCCLLDLNLSIGQLYLFGLCLSRGHQELRVIALKIIFDILSVHGTKVLDSEDGVDSLSFHKLLYRTLKNDELPELQALCAEGLCKLYLADILADDELFETLILTYYNPANSENQSLLQAFAFCLPVYCFSHTSHQEKLSKIACDAFTRLYNAHAEDDENSNDMVSPQTILNQLIHWTDPSNVVNTEAEEVSKSENHVLLATELLHSFTSKESKKYKKLVLVCLSKLYIGDSVDYSALKKLFNILEETEEDVQELDTHSRNAYKKFRPKIEELLRAAEEKKAEDPTMKEFSIILEEDEEEESEEIDEDFEKEQSRIIDAVEEEDASLPADIQEGDFLDNLGDENAPEVSLQDENDHEEQHVENDAMEESSVDSDGDLSME